MSAGISSASLPPSPGSTGMLSPQSVGSPAGSPQRTESPIQRIQRQFTDSRAAQKRLFLDATANRMDVTTAQVTLIESMNALEKETQQVLSEIEKKHVDAQAKVISLYEDQSQNQRSMQSLKETIESLQGLCKDIEAKHKVTFEELEEVKRQLSSTQTSVQGTQQQLETKSRELKEKEKSLAEQLDRAQKLSEAINDAQLSEKAMCANYERMQQSNADLERSLGLKEGKILDLEGKLNEALSETQKTRECFTRLQKDFEERGTQINKKTTELLELRAKWESHAQSVESLLTRTKELMETIREKDKTIESLKSTKIESRTPIPTTAVPTVIPKVTPKTTDTEKDQIIGQQKRLISTLKKVACVALALFIVAALGVTFYVLFPNLVASGIAAVAQGWKNVLALAAKASQTPFVNPAIYALRGRLGV